MPKKPRLSKAARKRLQEQREIEADILEQAEKRKIVAAGNALSDLLSGMMKQAGRMHDVGGVMSGENQTLHYGDAQCADCGKHWAETCPHQGRPHSESHEPVHDSPWRSSTRAGSWPAPEPDLPPVEKKRHSLRGRRSSSPRN